MSIRPVKRISQSRLTQEGAGVNLRRAFGFGDTSDFDPFLMMDDFRSDRPSDYRAGFPWHPHRGIETITYVLAGSVDHGDSLGNTGVLGPGDVQWMTAGSGILHQEMPKGDQLGRMHGFQLWANLPSSLKMTAPRYQDVPAQAIPEVIDDDGTRVRVICGDFWGKAGPVDGVAAEPRYLDVFVPPGKRKILPVETYRQAFAYIFEGTASFAGAELASVAQAVAVRDAAREHGGDGLDPAMRMPGKAGRVILGPIVAEIVHHEERIEIGGVAEAERAAQADARALHGRPRLGDALDGTNGHGPLLVEFRWIRFPKYCRRSYRGMTNADKFFGRKPCCRQR